MTGGWRREPHMIVCRRPLVWAWMTLATSASSAHWPPWSEELPARPDPVDAPPWRGTTPQPSAPRQASGKEGVGEAGRSRGNACGSARLRSARPAAAPAAGCRALRRRSGRRVPLCERAAGA